MDFEKERREAVEAGNRALVSLESAYRDLKSARNWGILDILGSRSFISSIVKHSKMDRAQEHMDQARYDLQCFSRELNDVNRACDLNINVSGLLSFADVFMDNIFSDLIVQSRISRAASQVEQAIKMTKQILDQLARY